MLMALTDEELIERYQSSVEPTAAARFADELLSRYSERVASWCWRFADDRETALDLSQEVLLRAFRHLSSFRLDSKFSTWLYSIARNHCLNHVRQQASEPGAAAEPLCLDPQDDREWDVVAELQRESAIRAARELMRSTLDETETKVMTLHYYDDMSLDAITRMLGLKNQSGAKAFLVNARRKLAPAVRRWRGEQAVAAR